MNLSPLLSLLTQKQYFRRLVEEIASGKSLRKTIVFPDETKAYILASLNHDLDVPLLVITPHPDGARQLYDEIQSWITDSSSVLLFPEAGFLPENYIAPDSVILNERMKTLSALVNLHKEDISATERSFIVITHASAAASYIMSPDNFLRLNMRLSIGMSVSPAELITAWQSAGYSLETIVEVPGSISHRGGIIDVFSRNYDMPVRLEFLGNQIDSIRFFDPKTQRSIRIVSSVDIVPAGEINETSHESTIFNYLPANTIIVMDDRQAIESVINRINEQWDEFLHPTENETASEMHSQYLTIEAFSQNSEKYNCHLNLAPWISDNQAGREAVSWPFMALQSYGGRYDSFIRETASMIDNYGRILIITQQPQRLNELFLDRNIIASFVEKINGVPAERSLVIVRGSLSAGWLLKDTIAVITDREIFGIVKQQRITRKRPVRHHTFTNQFTEGDYVVHVDHGIAKFAGIAKRAADDGQKEYLVLQYAGDDRLYVPVEQIDRVSRYIGASDQPPSLSHFGTQEWVKTKLKVRQSVIDMAKKLLDLYAARETTEGYAFSPDSIWQQELELSFPYNETQDQLAAINAVKHDMENRQPMDRLVCGDVGYGKTEVALRAAFKAVMDNKQVAVLVPTTILAQQHYNTFSERLKAFPARIKMLSRFCSPLEEREIIRELSTGQVDICIGTHRLLQKDILFKNLGLVIIDEEQRFGVAHKEHLKEMSHGVDVLTLSATPIPRTLHMSLIGIRDMSTIETMPEERLPITTYVGSYDERTIREAILRELERKGQVFFVHNRVSDIDVVAAKIKTLVPEARVIYAHGQMSEDRLERVMADFSAKRADVLVTTTIIESGLDMPNVNTLIVDRADIFGLTQLYQLRGRIGRGTNVAYAYFLYTRNEMMNCQARKRLSTIAEATELGAGFAIAMRDLEIRGAGNLLGAEQSGHIASVGYDLYCNLLAEAVNKMKEGDYRSEMLMHASSLPSISLPLEASIPDDYIPAVNERLSFYHRLIDIRSVKEIGEITEEFIDRYGQLPVETKNLLFAVRVRLLASNALVESISHKKGKITIVFGTAVELNAHTLLKRYVGLVSIGHKQIRIDCTDGEWKSALMHVLEIVGLKVVPS